MSDDVVEAMARGMWEASDAPGRIPYGWDKLAEVTRERMRHHARAAIRAVTARGGLVVGKMPEHWPASTGTLLDPWEKGFNAALAAVRAAAVEVEP